MSNENEKIIGGNKMKRKNILAMGLLLLISATVFAGGCVDENAPAAPTPVTPVATPTAAPATPTPVETPVATPAVASAPVAPTTVLDETTTMYADEYMSYSERLDKGDTITISVTTDGSPIDLFLMNAQDFDEYESMQTRYITYYVDGSALHVVSKTYTWTVPESDTYYIVADNTDIPDGGAYAGRAVNVHVVITG
jgi:hypothetical protein